VIAVFAALPSLGLVAGPSYAALVYGLGVIQLLAGIAVLRRCPALDRNLGALAAGFVAWCWVSATWSIDPARTVASALQMTVIVAGCLVVLAIPPLAGGNADRLFRVLCYATLAGGTVFFIDRALDYPLQTLLMSRSQADIATKYNRGIDHLTLIVWPILGYFAYRRDWRRGLLLAAAVVAIQALGLSLAGKAAMALGLAVLAAAFLLPRIMPALLATTTLVFVVGLPLGMRLLGEHRETVLPYLKTSGIHRLEIWDFMAVHVVEHPLMGWGFGTATRLPFGPAELDRYVLLREPGVYPHNQWLGVWVESGAVGIAIAAGFALLVLGRIRRLAPALQPFGYAAFAAAMVISCVNFEVKTDSWWAALAATAWLLVVLDARIRDSAMAMTKS
jgi:hypothetical protein